MKSVIIRLICVILAIIPVILVFSACGKKKPQESAVTTEPVSTKDWGDLIPKDLKFDGQEIRVYAWQEVADEDWQSEMSSDIINNAVWSAREEVAGRLGVDFNISFQPGHWDNRNTFISNLSTYLGSGIEFDLIDQYMPTAAIGAMQGLYTDLTELPYLNFNQPWWPGNVQESCGIGDHVYFCSGDITQTLINCIGAMYINLDLWNDFNIQENIYDLVENREWTMEKMQEVLLNGRTGSTDNPLTRKYGLIMNGRIVYDNLFYGAGLSWVSRNENGDLYLSDDVSGTRVLDWYNICHDLLWKNEDVGTVGDPRPGADSANEPTLENAFMAGRAIAYMSLELRDAKNYIREAPFDFAVVPYPLFDKNQKDYRSITGYSVSLFSVPTSVGNRELIGAVLEALGSSGYRNITPKVYEQSFRLRFLQNEENAKMLDLIHDSIVYDTGRIFADDIAMFNLFRNAFYSTLSWTQLYEGRHVTWEANIETVTNRLGG